MSAIDTLLGRNAEFSTDFALDHLPPQPAMALAIVTCMDARVNPYALLGLEVGDAHVMRNAGGAVTDDVIRSLAVSQRVLGTREVVLIQHTDCGMSQIRDDDLKDKIEAETGVRPAFAMETFSDLDEQVRRSLARIEGSPFIKHKNAVSGFIYAVETGRLRRVR